MTKKQIYMLALRSTQATLREYFGDQNGFKDHYLQKTDKGKSIVKKVYDLLEPGLLDPAPTGEEVK